MPRRGPGSGAAAAAVLACCAVLYAWNLGGWLAHDDQGHYLYAAWRMTEGDAPYRDIRTTQQPLFLLAGAGVFTVFGPEPVAAKGFAVATALAALAMVYAVGRRSLGAAGAVLALLLVCAHPYLVMEGRQYRADVPMLALVAAGLAAVHRRPGAPSWGWWGLAGLLHGAGVFTKLFAGLAVAALAAAALVEAARDPARRRGWLMCLLAYAAGCAVTAAVVLFAVRGVLGPYLRDTLLHHTASGAPVARLEAMGRATAFFGTFFRENTVLVVLAGIGATHALRERKPVFTVHFLLAASAAAFLLMSRPLSPRYLMYVLPSLAVLAALALERFLWRSWWRIGAVGLAALVVIPHVRADLPEVRKRETGTKALAAHVRERTAPEDYVLIEYGEINLLARRRVTPAVAYVSRRACETRQLTTADVIGDIERYVPRMVVKRAKEGDLQYLTDLRRFKDYLRLNYCRWGQLRRGGQVFDAWERDLVLPRPAVVGFSVRERAARPGGPVVMEVELANASRLYACRGTLSCLLAKRAGEGSPEAAAVSRPLAVSIGPGGRQRFTVELAAPREPGEYLPGLRLSVAGDGPGTRTRGGAFPPALLLVEPRGQALSDGRLSAELDIVNEHIAHTYSARAGLRIVPAGTHPEGLPGPGDTAFSLEPGEHLGWLSEMEAPRDARGHALGITLELVLDGLGVPGMGHWEEPVVTVTAGEGGGT